MPKVCRFIKSFKVFKISILLLISLLILIVIASRGCPKRSRDKTGGSNELPVLAAPSNLIATLISFTQINLSWQDNSTMPPEDGFEIWRSLDGINWGTAPITTTSANTISYSDIGTFSIGVTYYYRVRAFNTLGDISDWSNIAGASIDESITISAIAAGTLHSLALDSYGRVWSWGYNYFGQLGLNDWRDRSVPILITSDINFELFENIESITAGGGDYSGNGNFSGQSFSRKTEGTLWSWGFNYEGELGLGDNATTEAPYPVTGITTIDSDWSIIAAGGFHTIALKINRTIWTWGQNWYGQLGVSDVIDRWTPTQILIGTDTDWSMVAGGAYHTIALKTAGTLWTWGQNWYGQLGLGSSLIIPNRITPTQIGSQSNWYMVAGGDYHTIALKTLGTLWAWGHNEYSQLGLGDTITRWTPAQVLIGTDTDWSMVTGGAYHTLALKTRGTLWTWGQNRYGQLGLGDTITRSTPAQVDIQTDWSLIAGGAGHSLGLKTNGTLWAWGYNNLGQLGLADTTNRNTPALVIFYLPDGPTNLAAIPISSSRIDLTWTDNSNNETGFKIERKIGRNGTYQEIVPQGVIGPDVTSWADISPSGFVPTTYYYYCIRAFNDIGNSAYSEAYTTLLGNWVQITAGNYHTIARKSNNTLWAWGYNNYGQLGLGNSGIGTDRNTPTPLGTTSDWAEVDCGGEHTFGRKTNNTLWAWGYNNYGQLGLGNSGIGTDRNTPTPLGTTSDWAEVDCGGEHTFGRKTNNTLWAWGRNDSGQLGLGYTTISTTGVTTPTTVGNTSDWAEITCGGEHTFGRKTANTLWAWGYNIDGRLGLGDNTNRNSATRVGVASDWIQIAAGNYHTLGRKTTNTLWSWGTNKYGQLGFGDNTDRNTPTQLGTASDWAEVAAGKLYTLGRKTTGTLWAWGSNLYGQLGFGDNTDRNTPTQLGAASDWLEITCGSEHTISRKANRTLWTWGYNNYGQLGLGDNGYGTDRNVPMPVEE